MPGLDKTGPLGKGSRTGRNRGRCNPKDDFRQEDFPRGRGFGKGMGRRLHLRRGWSSSGDGN